jgi:hypothetical protein
LEGLVGKGGIWTSLGGIEHGRDGKAGDGEDERSKEADEGSHWQKASVRRKGCRAV